MCFIAYPNGARGRDDTIHALGERIEGPIGPPHKVRLQKVSSAVIVLKLSLVQLHRQIGRLEVQRHHLTAGVPEYLHRENLIRKIHIFLFLLLSRLAIPGCWVIELYYPRRAATTRSRGGRRTPIIHNKDSLMHLAATFSIYIKLIN